MARQITDDPSDQEDTHLATLTKERDESAFRLLYNKHFSWVFSKTYRMLQNHQDTEEVCSDIFVKMWEKIDKWDTDQGSFQAWLNVVAKNTIIDAIRKKERIRESLLNVDADADMPSEYEDNRPTPDRLIESQEAQEILEQALAQVTKPNHRTAWILRHIEGCSIAEISQTLDRKEGTVKIWIFRCAQELKQILIRKGLQ
ncbi:MAG: RNA polymerase sigma factor [Candidatus Poribacteria bacterium]|nr:RNA polymerase sigma factor [Candidatus Poribacteria bacterium]